MKFSVTLSKNFLERIKIWPAQSYSPNDITTNDANSPGMLVHVNID